MLQTIAEGLQKIKQSLLFKQRIEEKIDKQVDSLFNMNKRLLRLEILDAMRRKSTATVYYLYDEYKALGGNSYIKDLYESYMKKIKEGGNK